MPTRSRDIYCYGPQRRSVEALLRDVIDIDPRRLRSVDDYYQLQGLEDVTFVIVTGHPHEVPERIHHSLQAYGAMVWNLDDSRRRDRYTREHGR